MVVDQQSVVLQAKFCVITDRRSYGLLAFVLFLWVAETGKVAALQDFCSSWAFFWVDLQHFQD